MRGAGGCNYASILLRELFENRAASCGGGICVKQIESDALSPFIEKVLLYGSSDRHEEKYSSDVDLCVVFTEEAETVPHFSVMIHRLKGILADPDPGAVDVDAKIFTGTDWETEDSLFLQLLKRDGKIVWQ